ncbi:MAG: protein kinase [Bryobacteraceae bacterium]|nr:protein kinase [Bryobacteraceae bacterium]
MSERRVGEYIVLQKLGTGAFCESYLGERAGVQTQVILKRVHPALVAMPKICVRLRAQAISPPRLEHPRIAALITILLDRDEVWLVRELATGVPVEDTLVSPKPAAAIVPAFCRLLEAFDHAHRHGMTHANIKGTNLWIEPGGEFRVLDFAMSRLFGYGPATRDLLSNAAYRSPEQAAGEEIDTRADIYSMGVMLGRLLGRPEPSFAAVLERACATRREDRFRTMAEFRSALMECLENPESTMNILDRIRVPLQSMLNRAAPVQSGNGVRGHAHPYAVEPAEPAPAPPPPALMRRPSLREMLANEVIDFEPSRLASFAPEPSPAPVKKVAEPPPAVNGDDYSELLDAGFAAFRSGDFLRAKQLWQRARAIDSSNRTVDYNLRVVERKLAAANGR